MEERRGVYRVWVGNLRERDHLGDTGVAWTGSSWLRMETGGGHL